MSGRNTSSGFHHQWNCQTGARTAQICLSGAVWAHRDLATTRGLHRSSYHSFSSNPINNQTKPIWATIWGSSFFPLNKSLKKAIQRAYNVFILNKRRGDSELTGWAEFISGSAGGGDDWRTLMKNYDKIFHFHKVLLGGQWRRTNDRQLLFSVLLGCLWYIGSTLIHRPEFEAVSVSFHCCLR